MDQKAMVEKCKKYLKSEYGEDTVSMDVTNNAVKDGNGILSVDCTVLIGGSESDWSKKFTFLNGEVINMTWRRR
ncbi:MAG: hypothetical protein WCK36_03920 [Candidatus Firestonebacteria bacterium]